jgi:integral membrane sensor domain MASE1
MMSFKLFHSPTATMWTTWQHWFASDAVGIITVAPLAIGLAEALRNPPSRNEIIEGVAALLVFVVMTFGAARLAVIPVSESLTSRGVQSLL